MKTIVITGSTRGIGYGLADAFLERGCSVAISGRTRQKVDEAVTELAARHGSEWVLGHPCDVTHCEQVQALWDAAVAHWGKVDIWINNAGIGHAQTAFWEHEPEEIASVVKTNVIGAMYGTRVALSGMLKQSSGSIYNLEGLGSGRTRVEGLTLYSTTKHSLKFLTDSLVEEVKGTPVLVGALQPGMVVTDLLTRQYEERPEEWERAKWVFNILADRVEAVTSWLADRVLANGRNGARFKYLSRGKAMGRFLTAPFSRRDLFAEDQAAQE